MYITGWPLFVLVLSAVWFWLWVIVRLAYPFKCSCGRAFWLPRSLFKHLGVKHGYSEK